MEQVQRVQPSLGEKIRNNVLAPWFVGAAALVGAIIAHKTGVLPELPGLEIVNPVCDPMANITEQC